LTGKFTINTIRNRTVAALTVWVDFRVAEGIETVMQAVAHRFRAECANHGVSVGSAFTIEIQPSLFGDDAKVTFAAFVAPVRPAGSAPKGARSARTRARRAAS